MAGISSKAAGTIQNKEKTFQGQRFDDDLGLNWVQFKWRNHDPQIGRFIEVDPLSEKYVYNSTYAFSENKVTGNVELEGLESARMVLPAELTKQQVNDVYKGIDQSVTKQAIGAAFVGFAIFGILQPEIGIPMAVSFLSGAPVTPSPQAFATTSAAVVPTVSGETAGDETVTLFRGVNQTRTPVAFDEALAGNATPRGGVATASEHNAGNTSSPFTSWTTNPAVAENYALRPSGKGVVLEAQVPKAATVTSPSLKSVNLKQSPGKVVNESEVLIPGKIIGCKAQVLSGN